MFTIEEVYALRTYQRKSLIRETRYINRLYQDDECDEDEDCYSEVKNKPKKKKITNPKKLEACKKEVKEWECRVVLHKKGQLSVMMQNMGLNRDVATNIITFL